MSEEQLLRIKEQIRKTAERKFPGDIERQNAYIFGTLNKIKK